MGSHKNKVGHLQYLFTYFYLLLIYFLSKLWAIIWAVNSPKTFLYFIAALCLWSKTQRLIKFNPIFKMSNIIIKIFHLKIDYFNWLDDLCYIKMHTHLSVILLPEYKKKKTTAAQHFFVVKEWHSVQYIWSIYSFWWHIG